MENHISILMLAYGIFAIVAVTMEIKNIYQNINISMINMCKILFIIANVIMPIIIFWGYSRNSISTGIKYEDKYIWTLYLSYIYTIMAYVMFEFGSRIKQRIPIKKIDLGIQKVLPVTAVFLIVSIASLVLWASGFGGITMLIQNANHIRAGFIASSSNTAFFKHLVPLSMLSSYLLFYYLFIDDNIKSRWTVFCAIVMLIPSIIISFVFILANDGRLLAGFYILIPLVMIIKKNYEMEEKNLRKIIFQAFVLIVIVMALVINMDNILRIIRGQELVASESNGSFVDAIIKEFSFIVSGLQMAIIGRHDGSASLMIGNDVLNGLFAWFPSSLKPIICVDVWDYNTQLINSGGYGQAPTSIVAQSLYDLGMVGVIVIPALYGFIVKKIELHLINHENDIFPMALITILGFYLAKGMAYFSLYNIMINIFFIVVGVIIVKVFSKITFGRR